MKIRYWTSKASVQYNTIKGMRILNGQLFRITEGSVYIMIMKKILSLMLAICLVFATSALVFADDTADNANNNERSSSSSNYWDYPIGNCFTVTGQSIASGYWGYASTTFKVKTYGGGVQSSVYGMTAYPRFSSLVGFSDGASSNTNTLTNNTYSIYFYSDGSNYTHGQSYGPSISYTFMSPISIVSCNHTFSTSTGANGSFYTTAYGY